jgi:tetratricopeptide (TPR) repeat protein
MVRRMTSLRRLVLPCAAAAALAAATLALAQTGGAGPLKRPAAPLPPQELSEPLLYELLLGEIALQRGSPGLAAQTYVELAKRTRDPRIARRAVEVANLARMPQLAIEAAKTWHDVEPASAQALQVVAALLVAARRVEEAEPYLVKLLAADGANVENGFLQLNRLLSGNPDKAANLRVVERLAALYPALAQARLAVAQAALLANDDALALDAARRALEARPDWETAAVLEAQVLQRKSPAAAAQRLAEFLEKYPGARDARMSYARALVLDKRLPEARVQFERLLAASPGNSDVIYAVGLLAYQLKDYAVAESSMKQLLDKGYRDPNQVRYVLGQIAEDQKLWPQAIEWYRQIKAGQHALAARMRTANAIAKQGKVDEARVFLRRIEVEGREERVQLVVAEAQLLREANRTGDAYEMLGEELAKDPEQPELLYDHALTAEKLERYEVAEKNLRKLIQVKPDHAHAYNALGYSFAERNLHLPEARKLIEKALELAPEDHFIIDSLGWVLYREGDLKGAAVQLRRAYEGRPDGEIGAHLGEVLWMLGEREEADRVLKESLKNHPENETLQKTIKRLGM